MNVALHFVLNYLILALVFEEAKKYVFVILIFSIIIDIDHIPYIANNWRYLIKKKFGSASRTLIHELYGLMIFSIIFSIAYLYFDTTIVKIAALSIVLHYSADLIVGKTRPFFPYSKEEIFLGIIPEKYRMHFEIVATIIFGGLVWLFLLN